MFKKISIIGTGAVGSSLAYALLSRLNIAELSLIDIADGLAKGVALDLEDTRAFLKFDTDIIAGSDFSLIKDSNLVVMTAGVARKEGMSRLDLLKINAKVTKEVAQKIKEFCPQAIVIVITNPLDLITYVMTKETGFSRNRVFGMGSILDTARLLNILSKISKSSVNNLEAMVFGLHNNDMVISGKHIKIKGQTADKILKSQEIKDLQEKTSLRGGEIVGYLKSRSAHFAPALSACHLIEAIVNDKEIILPVSVMLMHEYGLDNVCMGTPCVVGRTGIKKVIELELTDEEKNKIEKVKEEFRAIKEIYP